MTDERFKAELLALIPHVRAFAYSIAKRPHADDLAQEAMLKAWRYRASYQANTNLRSWVFTILRNQLFSDARRSWRSVELDPEVAANILVTNDNPCAAEELLDVRNAMQQLPTEQREALVLVGAAGLSYEETSEICGCAIGTVKSRVNRARAALAGILELQSKKGRRAKSDISATHVFADIMHSAELLKRRIVRSPNERSLVRLAS